MEGNVNALKSNKPTLCFQKRIIQEIVGCVNPTFAIRVLVKNSERLGLANIHLSAEDLWEYVEEVSKADDEDDDEIQDFEVIQEFYRLCYHEEIEQTLSANVNLHFESFASAYQMEFLRNGSDGLPMTVEEFQRGLSAFTRIPLDGREDDLMSYMRKNRWSLPLSDQTPLLTHPSPDTLADLVCGFVEFVRNGMGPNFCTNFLIEAQYNDHNAVASEKSQWPQWMQRADGIEDIATSTDGWTSFFKRMSSSALEPPFICLVQLLYTPDRNGIRVSYHHVASDEFEWFPLQNFVPYMVQQSSQNLIWFCGTRDLRNNLEAHATFGGRRFRVWDETQMIALIGRCGYDLHRQTSETMPRGITSLSRDLETDACWNEFPEFVDRCKPPPQLIHFLTIVDCAGAQVSFERFADMAEMYEQNLQDENLRASLSQARFTEQVNTHRPWGFQDSAKDQTVTNSFWNYLFRIRWGDMSIDVYPRSVARYPDMTSIIFIAEHWMQFVRGGLGGLPCLNVIIRTQFEGYETQTKWKEWNKKFHFELIGNLRENFAGLWTVLFLSLTERDDCCAPFVCLMDIGGNDVLSGDIHVHFVTMEEFNSFYTIGQSPQIGMAKATRADFVWLYGVNDAPGTQDGLLRAYLGYGGKRQRLRTGKQLVKMMKRFGGREIRHSAWVRNYTMDMRDLREFSVEIFFGKPQAKSVGGHT